MALQKSKSYKGVELSYWCITGTSWNKENSTTSCTVTPFKDQAAREESLENAFNQPSRVFVFANPVNSNGVQELTIAELYAQIKATDDFFSDAVDC